MFEGLDSSRINSMLVFYAGLLSILVSNLCWARNISLFKDKFIPLEITIGVILNLAVEFKEESKAKKTYVTKNYLL
jgi:hypothetical protein